MVASWLVARFPGSEVTVIHMYLCLQSHSIKDTQEYNLHICFLCTTY